MSTTPAQLNRPCLRRRIGKRMRGKHVPGVGYPKDKGLRRRLRHAIEDPIGWWDWARVAMVLAGRDDGGEFSPPEPRAWYWFENGQKPRKWGRRARSRLVIVKSYDAYRAYNEGVKLAQERWRLNHPVIGQKYLESIDTWVDERGPITDDDRCPEEPYWHYFNVQDDGGTLIAGNVYGERGGVNYGLSRAPARLLVRYIVVEWWLKANWLGIRPWIYYKGLHRVVDFRRPFRCNVRPSKEQGGYSHWACGEPKRHKGEHRVRNYTWTDDAPAVYAPVG